jgi:hypothetical protein
MTDRGSITSETDPPGDGRRVAGLATIFAVLYFIQGISEPSEGLVAQPIRSLLRNWGYKTDTIASFMAALVLPWSIKPIYGLLTDFVPLAGTRRRSWLLLTSLVTAVSLVAIYAFRPPAELAWLLLVLLFLPTIGVAFSDVVIDALMVEEGQPRGMTGTLQSVQWTSNFGRLPQPARSAGPGLFDCWISHGGELRDGLADRARTASNGAGRRQSSSDWRGPSLRASRFVAQRRASGHSGDRRIHFLVELQPVLDHGAVHAHGRAHGLQRAILRHDGFDPGRRVIASQLGVCGILPPPQRGAARPSVDRDGRAGEHRVLGAGWEDVGCGDQHHIWICLHDGYDGAA